MFKLWDPTETVINNIEKLLNVKVVRKEDNKADGVDDLGMLDCNYECAVCYCLHLEDQLPNITCAMCNRAFHLNCLYDVSWDKGFIVDILVVFVYLFIYL